MGGKSRVDIIFTVTYLPLFAISHSTSTFTAPPSAALPLPRQLKDCTCWVSQTGKPAYYVKGLLTEEKLCPSPAATDSAPCSKGITTNSPIFPSRHRAFSLWHDLKLWGNCREEGATLPSSHPVGRILCTREQNSVEACTVLGFQAVPVQVNIEDC